MCIIAFIQEKQRMRDLSGISANKITGKAMGYMPAKYEGIIQY